MLDNSGTQLNIETMQTPIEIALKIDDKGTTTARALYEFLELNPANFSHWVKRNITTNEFATENEDYMRLVFNDETPTGGIIEREDYRLTAHFAKKLSMKGSGKKAELAREYFAIVEEKTKAIIASQVDRKSLSPELQMVYALADNSAKLELEQKRQAEQIKAVETKLNNMQEIFTEPLGDWKADINKRVREISIKSGIDFQSVYNEMYGELETTAHCSLKRLQENKVNRMKKAGNTKTAINEGTTKIAIIYDKPQLKVIFEGIVKKWAMRYCA